MCKTRDNFLCFIWSTGVLWCENFNKFNSMSPGALKHKLLHWQCNRAKEADWRASRDCLEKSLAEAIAADDAKSDQIYSLETKLLHASSQLTNLEHELYRLKGDSSQGTDLEPAFSSTSAFARRKNPSDQSPLIKKTKKVEKAGGTNPRRESKICAIM